MVHKKAVVKFLNSWPHEEFQVEVVETPTLLQYVWKWVDGKMIQVQVAGTLCLKETHPGVEKPMYVTEMCGQWITLENWLDGYKKHPEYWEIVSIEE